VPPLPRPQRTPARPHPPRRLTMTTSLVIETWNLGRAIEAGIAPLLARVRAQSLIPDELIVTHDRLDAAARARLDARAGRAITWVELPPGADTFQLVRTAISEERVAFSPGDAFAAGGSHARHCLRLAFANHSPEQIEEGVARLARAVARAVS
ncbi:MAG TPA: hypothetical protein VEG34_01875, partial [Thermoanaerobaculia bacterium]|nr:hypothetical protein [Thermoanaerobaculia bacterium]